ncbi:HlyD family efflux transporter periplasmic adaptor subunit [Gammaproteobacteria bacterium]|nr:HlyD family efflux transporter periplasmic adaptor subunit [Gammaproteobacteria bacterium]
MNNPPVNNTQATPDAQIEGRQLSVLPKHPIMQRRSLVTRAMDRVVPRKGRFLGLTWILALAAVLALLHGIQGEATQFYGIAESQLRAISFQHPVEIVDIPVVEGERVEYDTQLLEVRRYDLDISRQVIDEQINEIEAQQQSTRHMASTEITNLKAELETQLQGLSTQIDSLESTQQLNQALLKSISSTTASTLAESSPMATRISGLKAQKAGLRQLFQAKIDQQKQRLRDLSGPAGARIAELEKKKLELDRQSQALVVRAPFAGSVGSVLFKRGEQVEAFKAVMSVQGIHPRSIKGYIHEAVSNRVQIGQQVWVQSLNAIGENQLVRGKVDSLGSRIVEYPERLKRSPLVSAWGREAIISLDPDNDILQGEKVTVLLDRPQPISVRLATLVGDYLPVAHVHAWVRDSPYWPATDLSDIDIQIDLPKTRQLEASGLVWDAGTARFLLISDEHSAVFELSQDGKLGARIDLPAESVVNDLESISHEGQYYYLAASLSRNHKGVLPAERRKLLRLQLQQSAITSIESLDLYQILVNLAGDSQTNTRLRHFMRAALDSGDFDLESHAVWHNRLYLGFKSPLDADNKTLILRLDDVDRMFAGDPPEASIWLSLDLGSSADDQRRHLSDFAITDSGLYLLSVSASKKHPVSYLSHFDTGSRVMTRIAEYPGIKAEGISIDPSYASATIVFDGGGKSPSQWLRRTL